MYEYALISAGIGITLLAIISIWMQKNIYIMKQQLFFIHLILKEKNILDSNILKMLEILKSDLGIKKVGIE